MENWSTDGPRLVAEKVSQWRVVRVPRILRMDSGLGISDVVCDEANYGCSKASVRGLCHRIVELKLRTAKKKKKTKIKFAWQKAEVPTLIDVNGFAFAQRLCLQHCAVPNTRGTHHLKLSTYLHRNIKDPRQCASLAISGLSKEQADAAVKAELKKMMPRPPGSMSTCIRKT